MRKRMFTRQLGVPVTEENYQKIVTLCNEQEESVSEWVRNAIELKMVQGMNNNHIEKEN